jgi:beta-N-acetylhexosaminidase
VILSDDLEMKAVAATRTVPEAAVEAIQAGCDAVLVCGGDVEVQAQTLEALVRAAESGDITAARLDDAVRRLVRTKARFLAGERAGISARQRALRTVLGCDAHQLVAAEMAAFL